MQFCLLLYFYNKPLYISSRLVAHHQEDQLCMYSNWYMSCIMLTGCWQDRDGSRSCQQPVNTTYDYTNRCLYRVDPPDDEQQACSKYIEAYYRNKLTLRRLMSYIYGAPILDVSRSHTTTQHSR